MSFAIVGAVYPNNGECQTLRSFEIRDLSFLPENPGVRGNGGDSGTLDPEFEEDIHAFELVADLYEDLAA